MFLNLPFLIFIYVHWSQYHVLLNKRSTVFVCFCLVISFFNTIITLFWLTFFSVFNYFKGNFYFPNSSCPNCIAWLHNFINIYISYIRARCCCFRFIQCIVFVMFKRQRGYSVLMIAIGKLGYNYIINIFGSYN